MDGGHLEIDAAAVRALVAEQFPQWRDLPVTAWPGGGTVHRIFRLGDELVARFPVQVADPDSLGRQLRAAAASARTLAAVTRIPVPEPVAIGDAGAGFPAPWSVQRWLPGRTAGEDDPSRSVPFARDLAVFVRDVRTLPVAGHRIVGRGGRGGDLQAHDDWVQECFAHSEGLIDVPRVRAMWCELRELPRYDVASVTHGDLIPANLLVSQGRLAGVIDLDEVGVADPAVDLIPAWAVLDGAARDAFRREVGCSDLQWERGRAWAFEQAMGLVWYYVDSNPPMSALGRRTLDRLLAVTERAPAARRGSQEPSMPQ